MGSAEHRSVGIAPADLDLLGTPLEFIRAEHRRQSTLCDVLDELAEAPQLDVAKAEAAVAYLARDMAIHVIDEEEDLFPLLRRRCRPEDEIEAVLGTLSSDHRTDEDLARGIGEALTARLATGVAVSEDPELRGKLTVFAERARRHLEIEDEAVLPIARSRLTEADTADFARRLAARRGIAWPAGDAR